MTSADVIVWEGAPVAFQVNGLDVSWYGLLNVAAFLLGLALFAREARAEPGGLDPLRVFRRVFWGAYLGSRLWYALFDAPSHFWQHPLDIFRVWQGGRASFGGVIGAGLALLSGRAERARRLWLADRLSLATGLGFALVRCGNFLNSELVGRPTAGPLGVVFARVDRLPRHPVQLYEIAVYLVASAAVVAVARPWRGQDGRRFGLFLVLAYGGRLLLEPLKERTSEIALDPWLCLAAVVIGIGLSWRRRSADEAVPVPARAAVG